MSKKRLRYRMGIDVGLHSVGLAAIEIDDSNDNPLEAMPLGVLNAMSVIHDGAVDPNHTKYDDSLNNSRKAIAGVARRTRRLNARRRSRLDALDKLLREYGFPVEQANDLVQGIGNADPYLPWRARAEAAEGFIEEDNERLLALTVALRHIARHRGWRNPYASEASLAKDSESPSKFYEDFAARVERWRHAKGLSVHSGTTIVENEGSGVAPVEFDWTAADTVRLTPAQLVVGLLEQESCVPIRRTPDGPEQLPTQMGKLHQSDYWHEADLIMRVQGVSDNQRKEILQALFDQVNPKDVGAAAKLVAKDYLQPQFRRASRASLVFQRFRILDTVTNLRIADDSGQRPLNVDEVRAVYEFLASEDTSASGEVSWHDVADVLQVDRGCLRGVGGQTRSGDPISAKIPPYLTSEHAVLTAIAKKEELASLGEWWRGADDIDKETFIEFLGNTGLPAEENLPNKVLDLFARLNETALASLDKIKLPAGRAAYSADTLSRLNKRMLGEGVDMFTARKEEFGVDDDWAPMPNALGTPTGNPAVDRTIKIAARWIRACERKWGKPETVNIEHVRQGFTSQKQQDKIDAENSKRYEANLSIKKEIVKAMEEEEGSGATSPESVHMADVRRWQALTRQNCQCLYCGAKINMKTSQMDHIVPRKGPGSSNVMANLAAVCESCNKSKSNTLFYNWASEDVRKKAIERVDTWIQDSYFTSNRDFDAFKRDVKARLMQKEEDDPIDNRSIESVAWMARELREQIEGYFGYEKPTTGSTSGNDDFELQRVMVFRGSITSEARKASGLENKLPWIGDRTGKTRLDRRHHAVDAAVIALMRPAVGKIIAERNSIRRQQLDSGISKDELEASGFRYWKNHGDGNAKYCHWRDEQMTVLIDLLEKAMENDKIVVTNPLRLSLGMGRAHKDTVYPLIKKHVGDKLSAACIDKSVTGAQWVALTRDPAYDRVNGLPADSKRRIRIHDKMLGPDDVIGFMATEGKLDKEDAVYSPVRGGFAGIGTAIHHARFYRIPKKGKQTEWKFAYMRVFQQDLLKHRKENLFEVDIPPQAISRRMAESDLRESLDAGTAQYLGWAVVGDEVVINPEHSYFSPEGKNKINLFMRAFPMTKHFKITGFEMRTVMKLKPLYLSEEGCPDLKTAQRSQLERTYGDWDWDEGKLEEVNKIIISGFRPSIDRLLSTFPTFVRRDALGNVRWHSDNGMPVSWKVTPYPSLES